MILNAKPKKRYIAKNEADERGVVSAVAGF